MLTYNIITYSDKCIYMYIFLMAENTDVQVYRASASVHMNSRLFINHLLSAVLSAECRGLCFSFKVSLTINAFEKIAPGCTRTHIYTHLGYLSLLC